MGKSWWIMGLVMSFGLLMTGCKAPGLTQQQVHMRHAETINQNMLQVQDDIDSIFMIDRPGRMTPLLIR